MALPLPSTLILDSYLDGESDRRTRDETTAGMYVDPATQPLTLSAGTIASKLPPSRHGARGVVIPHATRHGRSAGWNPQNPPHRRVIVDPAVQGGSLELDFNLITADAAVAAVRDSTQMVPEVHEIEDERTRAAVYFHLLGERFGRKLETTHALEQASRYNGSAPGVTPVTGQPPVGEPTNPVVPAPLPPAPAPVPAPPGANSDAALTFKTASFFSSQPLPPPGVAPVALASQPVPASSFPQQPPGRLLELARKADFAMSASVSTASSVPREPGVRLLIETQDGTYKMRVHALGETPSVLAIAVANDYDGDTFIPRQLLGLSTDVQRNDEFALSVGGDRWLYLLESNGAPLEILGHTIYTAKIKKKIPNEG
jgi:hypothetical protein